MEERKKQIITLMGEILGLELELLKKKNELLQIAISVDDELQQSLDEMLQHLN